MSSITKDINSMNRIVKEEVFFNRPNFHYLFVVILFSYLVVSCEKKEDLGDENFSHEDIVSINSTAQGNLELIEYDGLFTGDVNGVKISLELDDDGTFKITEDGTTVKGQWIKLNDGSVFQLKPKKGNIKFSDFFWSDQNTLLILNEDGNFPDEEHFLKRNK